MQPQHLVTKPQECQPLPYDPKACPYCLGFGKVWVKQAGSPVEVICSTCSGDGKTKFHK